MFCIVKNRHFKIYSLSDYFWVLKEAQFIIRDIENKLKEVNMCLQNTVECCKFEVLFGIISGLNYREVDINIYNPQKWLLSVFLANILGFGHIKETSQGDDSFMAPKHMIL